MRMMQLIVLAAGMIVCAWNSSQAAEQGQVASEHEGKIPVILDTDIGGDIDDTWALALLLKSPEFDVKLVVSDLGDTVYRAKIIAKILETAKRTEIPVGIGIRQSDKAGPQAAWVADYDLDRYPGKVHQDGVAALIETIMTAPTPITLICIGPMPNIKAALEKEPRIAERARFVGMHGSVRLGYEGKPTPDPECNVVSDVPAAARIHRRLANDYHAVGHLRPGAAQGRKVSPNCCFDRPTDQGRHRELPDLAQGGRPECQGALRGQLRALRHRGDLSGHGQ